MEHRTVLFLVVLAVALTAWAALRRRPSAPDHPPERLEEAALIDHVRLAVNPRFPRWVLFSGGTYVIVEEELRATSARAYALEHMTQFGPVHPGSPAADFSVIVLNDTDGWLVSGHGYGLYTYVHPSELGLRPSSDVEVGLLGRHKRALDAVELRIIHMNGWD